METSGYFTTAKKLLTGQPTDIDIRRSVSTAYYAMFHHVCRHFGAIVVRPNATAYSRAWAQAFRHLDHSPSRQRCAEVWRQGHDFSPGLRLFAEIFVLLQDRRIEADYNPLATPSISAAEALISDAERAVASFDAASLEAQRAFVLFFGLKAKR